MPPPSRPGIAAVAALALVVALAAPTAAQAAVSHPANGRVDEVNVPRDAVTGFGGGTIFAPEVSGGARLGSVVVVPGFTDSQADMRWYGTDLAALGYVVFTIDTLATTGFPQRRAEETLAAADYLTGASAAKGEVDPARVSALGYSMGGGAVLEAAEARHTLKAVVALMPFGLRTSYAADTTPSLIITGQNDRLAIPFLMGRRMYGSIAAPTPKQYLELRGADHGVGQRTPNPTILDAVTTFLQRYVDDDASAADRICPPPPATGAISASDSYCGPAGS
ncbi:alpha/beta hydrolase [Clavibacter sepedonicus]|nr:MULTISPECIES: dienelactone hydrolase family protein [Clavibacter]MBD5380336.1 alpha/beta fold hydrolase [Clavibacter sp.]UUK67162.1 dienelactone hydrolase family protein [Clavibacter sepedonicus]